MPPNLAPPLSWSRAQWQTLFREAARASGRHNLGLISAGVAFYALLTLFPALSATVALFGLVGDPHQVGGLIDAIAVYAPQSVIQIAHDQMDRLLHADTSKLALHGGVSILVALWSAQQGGRSFLRALTIVNEHGRRRGLWGRYLAGGALTFGALFAALLTILTFALATEIGSRIGAGGGLLMQLLRPLLLIALMTGFALALYRWGPARRPPAWRWVWPGAVMASIVWLIVTSGFSLYADAFTPWRAIYGVFSGVFVLMLWLFLSTYIFLFGAEINAQLERVCAAEVKAGLVTRAECADDAKSPRQSEAVSDV